MSAEALVDLLTDTRWDDLAAAVRYLRNVEQWALRQVGLDYAVGDRVRIVDGWEMRSGSGWAPYRECLTGGATGTVQGINFNQYSCDGAGAWHADLILDTEWSCSLWGGTWHDEPGDVRRYWHGPANETPDGFAEPSPYDQEQYPLGRRHTFSMLATTLRRLDR